MTRMKWNILLAATLLALPLYVLPAGALSKGKEPFWVQLNSFDAAASLPETQSEEGFSYLLDEKQCNLGTDECYIRYVRKVVNSTGVQNCTHITIEYIKSFEHITVHNISIVRNGKTINELDLSKFKMMDRQGSLSENQYNDNISSMLLLEDVQVGDIIDVSYTSSGSNPIFEKKFYDYFNLGFSTPVARCYCSVSTPEGRPLKFKYYNNAPLPQISHVVGNTVYTWDIRNPQFFKMDDGTPNGYDPYPGVSISEHSNWKQVKNWAQAIYVPVLNARSPETEKIADEIGAEYPDEEHRLIAAVKYVQDRIRYFGIETGVNTHKPNPASSTLHVGYGDCKDKSVLLCALLRDLHIMAHPILVQSSNPGILQEHLPTPKIFDHVCVQARLHDSIYYFDATMASQKADLAHYHFPPYKYGLVITDSSSELTEIPYSDNGARTLMYTTLQAADTSLPVRMVVTTTYYGMFAEQFRNQWNSASHEELEKNYLNFYAREYPGIEASHALRITADDSVKDMIQTEEEYSIENFWKQTKEGWSREFFAYNLLNKLNRPKDKKRKMPIGINFPEHYVEDLTIELPFDFNPVRKAQYIANDAFTFTGTYTVDHFKKSLNLHYTYDTKADQLATLYAPKYFADVDLVSDMIDYSITWFPNVKETSGQFSLLVFIVFLLVLAVAVVLALLVYRRYDPPSPGPAAEGRSIGGWLLLPAISITVLPFYYLYYFYTSNYFTVLTVDMLFNRSSVNYHPAIGALVLADMALKTLLLAGSVLTLVLFFKKRSSLPRVFVFFIVYKVAVDIFVILGNALLHLESDKDTGMILVRSIIYAAVWIPYMLLSVRVKETFVHRFKQAAPELTEVLPEGGEGPHSAEEERPVE